MSVRNIALLIEYDGRPYLGWQRQKAGPSVEAELSQALQAVTRAKLNLVVAGRTDAGVHALGQVVNFRCASAIEGWRFAHALNAHLPETITVHLSRDADEGFDARLTSLSKRYRYRIYEGPQLPALDRNRCWHHRAVLDPGAMQHAADALVGELDFESFRSAQCDAAHARREMFSITVDTEPRPPAGRYIDIVFHANAYCRHMCRILAGTLYDVGRGRLDPEAIAGIQASRDRTRAGATAPPGGLTLLEVRYSDELSPWQTT